MIITWKKPGSRVRSRVAGDIAQWGFSPGSSLTIGAASFVSSGPTAIALSVPAATGGAGGYTYQWQRNSNGGAYADIVDGGGVTGATTTALSDGSAVAGILYGYQVVATDSASVTATSAPITAQIYGGGALAVGTASKSGQRRRGR